MPIPSALTEFDFDLTVVPLFRLAVRKPFPAPEPFGLCCYIHPLSRNAPVLATRLRRAALPAPWRLTRLRTETSTVPYIVVLFDLVHGRPSLRDILDLLAVLVEALSAEP